MEQNEKITNGIVENNPEELEEAVSTAKDTQDDGTTKLPPNVEKIKNGRAWLSYIIAAAVLAAITVLVGWARGGFADTDVRSLLGDWCDAFFVPGILGVCFGLLVLASNGGAFDMLVYGMKRFFELFRKDPIDRKYGSFYEYQQARKDKKRSFLYLIIVGGGYLVVGIVLFAVYYTI